MPRVNIYIRNEDWETWQSIQNKSEVIHAVLNDFDYSLEALPNDTPKVIKNLADVEEALEKNKLKPKPMKMKLCKHGNPLGQCLDRAMDRSCKL